jgi:hypothetical protein
MKLNMSEKGLSKGHVKHRNLSCNSLSEHKVVPVINSAPQNKNIETLNKGPHCHITVSINTLVRTLLVFIKLSAGCTVLSPLIHTQ